jgi:hypothetical protein
VTTIIRCNELPDAPRSPRQLWMWLEEHLDVHVPRVAHCPSHAAPFEYLAHSFFEDPGDALVWANRGGGKTFYGAAATLLDLLYKPGIRVLILGGSLDQSQRMYGYLRRFLERPVLRGQLRRATRHGLTLRNGSQVAVLAQSQTSVRVHHVQKLRCDEV